MFWNLLFVLGLSLPGLLLTAQGLRPPIRHALVMTGSFGELRPDHFHGGIDLRSSAGRAGDPIVAVQAGYIARVQVMHQGYGRAVYVRHADGRTSVYAHLERFSRELEAWVDTIRYARQREEADLILDPSWFPVKKGQLLGYMGMTGRSTGVHLHFELRDREGFHQLDPGLDFADDQAPEIRGLKFYALDDKLLPLFEKEVPLRRKGNEYRVKGDTLLVGAWRIGLGLAARDAIAQTPFNTGIRSIEITVDGEVVYHFLLDKLDMRLHRYVNAHMDYAEWMRSGALFHRCYPLPGNRLPLYPVMRKAGLVTLSSQEKREVLVVVTDKAGHQARLRFWIRRDKEMAVAPPRLYQFRIPQGERFAREDEDIQWILPQGALYETTFFEYARLENADGTVDFQLHHPGTPLHLPMEVRMALPNHEGLDRRRFRAHYRHQDQWFACGGIAEDDWLMVSARRLGTYRLHLDTLPPAILPQQPAGTYRPGMKLAYRIQEDVPALPPYRHFSWQVWVNGQWMPGEWNDRDNLLELNPRHLMRKGQNQLVLEARDDRGNHRRLTEEWTY